MIHQQYTTAIKRAYTGSEEIDRQYAAARSCREWLAALEIDSRLRDPLLGPVAAIEEALQDLAVRSRNG
jgi:hypothetical protein